MLQILDTWQFVSTKINIEIITKMLFQKWLDNTGTYPLTMEWYQIWLVLISTEKMTSGDLFSVSSPKMYNKCFPQICFDGLLNLLNPGRKSNLHVKWHRQSSKVHFETFYICKKKHCKNLLNHLFHLRCMLYTNTFAFFQIWGWTVGGWDSNLTQI